MNSTAPKLSRNQSLYLAAIRREGGRVIARQILPDGDMSVAWVLKGERIVDVVKCEKREEA